MTRNAWVLIAALGSALMLLGAFGFQYLGHMAPCELCLLQRWPHAAAVAIGVLAILLRGRLLPLLGAVAALTTSGLGVYHTGVERGWWQGPTACSSGSVSGLSTQDLLNQIMAAEVVRCDAVAWQMFGLSMATWNAIASLILALIWLRAATRDI